MWPLLVSYSLPAITGMAAMSIYNIVGAMYVGQWCDAYAVTAMALVFPVMNLMVAVGTLVGWVVQRVPVLRWGRGNTGVRSASWGIACC